MTHLFWLSDDAWAAIEPHLPQGNTSHVKAHRSAAGSKRESTRKRLGARAVEERAKSMPWPMIVADRSPSP
jgi:transposase